MSVDFIGEDPEFPAMNLLELSAKSKGWQSAKFCQYPIEIILQFPNIVSLSQIQFLSHQAKISTKIEVFNYMPASKQALDAKISLNDIDFKRIGYLSLNSNERSAFQAREFKTVYINTSALLLKLVFHKCYVNKLNLYNQVGIISVFCLGDTSEGGKKGGAPLGVTDNEMLFDSVTQDQLRTLQNLKDKAVEREDFDEAKLLKDTIERIKSVGLQLAQLEDRKKNAIENEDYDSAKIIKIEIDRLRKNIMVPAKPSAQGFHNEMTRMSGASRPQSGVNMGGARQQHFQNEQRMQPPGQFGGMGGGFDEQKIRGRDEIVPLSKEIMLEDKRNYDHPNNGIDNIVFDKSPKPLAKNREAQKSQNFTSSVTKEVRKSNDEIFRADDRQIKKDIYNSHEQQIIPAMRKGNNQPPAYEMEDPGPMGGGDKHNASIEEEKIPSDKLKYFDAISAVFGDEISRKIFSKNWNTREDGLTAIENEVKLGTKSKITGSQENEKILTAVMAAISQTINDKVAGIAVKTFAVLNTSLQNIKTSIGSSRSEFNSYVDIVMMWLLDRLGDNNARVREAAENSCITIAHHSTIGPAMLVNHITKGQVRKTSQNSTKHLAGRLGVLNNVIKEFGVGSEISFQSVLEYALNGFKNSNAEVRNNAYNVVIEVYRSIGGKIRSYIGTLRPAQMELLEKGFAEVDGGGAGGRSPSPQKKEPEEATIVTNIKPGGPKTKNKNPSQKTTQKLPNDNEAADETDEKSCQFCGKYDAKFNNETKDMHLWKDCPMLCTCAMCTQVIEVATYNEHLLEECEHHRSLRKCPRCKEPVHIDDFDTHTEEGMCAIPKHNANRCPLCHKDIMPAGEEGWKKHLLKTICPNNDRHP